MATNHKPVVRGRTTAIWRRLKLLPFNVQVQGEADDKAMAEKLRGEWPGILAWCVRGVLEWQAAGLDEPQKVALATGEYRRTRTSSAASWRRPPRPTDAGGQGRRAVRPLPSVGRAEQRADHDPDRLRQRHRRAGINKRKTSGSYRYLGLRIKESASEMVEGIIE